MFKAVHDSDPDPKLLAYQYLQTLPQLAQSPGNTMWVIPSEVTSALAPSAGPSVRTSSRGRAPVRRPSGSRRRATAVVAPDAHGAGAGRPLALGGAADQDQVGAAQACRAGHVQVNGVRAKPAATVKVGDGPGPGRRPGAGGRGRAADRDLVGAEPAAACLIDRSPPPPPRDPQAWPGRDPGMGRPTKRDRRHLDRSRGRRG